MKLFTQQITLGEMQTEIKREIAMRQKVYPGWIISGKLSERTAAERVLMLQAVEILIYKEIKRTEPQGDLFNQSVIECEFCGESDRAECPHYAREK